MKINVGIDLSTTQIGVALIYIKNNEKTFNSNYFKLKPYSYENNLENYDLLSKIISYINSFIGEGVSVELQVGIEVANFEKDITLSKWNPKIANRFNRYCGIIEALLFNETRTNPLINLDIKTFNSNEWYRFIAEKVGYWGNREERKKNSKKICLKNLNVSDNLSEDEYDALCIALFLDKCRDVETISYENRVIKASKKKEKAQNTKKSENTKIKMLKIEKELIIYKGKPKLTIPQTKKVERLEKELEEIKSVVKDKNTKKREYYGNI